MITWKSNIMKKIFLTIIISVLFIGHVFAADTSVETEIDGALDERGLWGPYWSNTQKGVIVFTDNGVDISFARTTDGGASWGTTEIEGGSTRHFACWYDKETPSDAGTLVHLTWLDSAGGAGSSDAFYITIDVDDGSQGTKRTIDAGLTIASGGDDNRITITKAVGGNLLMALSTQTEIECYRSVDAGENWTDRVDIFETGTENDFARLFPTDTSDNQDAACIFWDRDASELSAKIYDDSANTLGETSIAGSMTPDAAHYNYDGAVRHSDSHLLVAAHSNDDDAGDDLLTWDLTVDTVGAGNVTVTAKANIFTNQNEAAQVAMIINQQNDDVYVAYLKGGTWTGLVDVVFHLSDDDLATWETESAYSEAAADDNRILHGGRTIGDDGGRIQFAWNNDDFTELFVNLVNDIEIAAVSGAARRIMSIQ